MKAYPRNRLGEVTENAPEKYEMIAEGVFRGVYAGCVCGVECAKWLSAWRVFVREIWRSILYI